MITKPVLRWIRMMIIMIDLSWVILCHHYYQILRLQLTTFHYSIYFFFAEMKVLITGSPGVGKTTLIKSLCEDLTQCSGFYTEEIREGGKRIGFDIVTLDGSSRAPLARVNTSVKGPKVGQYTVILSDFEFLAQKSLNSKSIANSHHVMSLLMK